MADKLQVAVSHRDIQLLSYPATLTLSTRSASFSLHRFSSSEPTPLHLNGWHKSVHVVGHLHALWQIRQLAGRGASQTVHLSFALSGLGSMQVSHSQLPAEVVGGLILVLDQSNVA
jgi:hypothetical protein